MSREAFFIDRLISWYNEHQRSLPWRETNNPYFIWLSEIILQQTRVDQGLPYYLHFTEKYPTVEELANASEDEVMKSWEGLGYYIRARNLHATAKWIASNGGVFPNHYKGLLDLKGVGDYTASAIASFAFNQPVPVVDGNVFRLVSRFFGKHEDISKTSTRKSFKELLQPLIQKTDPAKFNNGIMEFGALQCTAKNPSCSDCPLQEYCWAYQNEQVTSLPYHSKKIKKQTQYFHYFILEEDFQWIRKRDAKGIWGGLYEFPGVSSDVPTLLAANNRFETFEVQHPLVIKQLKHQLTHKTLHLSFWSVESITWDTESEYLRVPNKNIQEYPFPKAMHWIYSYF